jgi:hypothetical protein
MRIRMQGSNLNPTKDTFITQVGIKHQKIFHEILYLEHLEEGIKRLNKATGMNFTINEQFKHSSKDKIVNSTLPFVGNLSWPLLKKHGIPSDYKYFYNLEIKEIVTKLYQLDIDLYGYQYPF